MDLTVGSRWQSAVSDTEVVVVRSPVGDVDLCCGGHPVVPAEADKPNAQIDPGLSTPTLIGKRYFHPHTDLEVLVTKGGDGVLAVGGVELELKGAKPLPSSD